MRWDRYGSNADETRPKNLALGTDLVGLGMFGLRFNASACPTHDRTWGHGKRQASADEGDARYGKERTRRLASMYFLYLFLTASADDTSCSCSPSLPVSSAAFSWTDACACPVHAVSTRGRETPSECAAPYVDLDQRGEAVGDGRLKLDGLLDRGQEHLDVEVFRVLQDHRQVAPAVDVNPDDFDMHTHARTRQKLVPCPVPSAPRGCGKRQHTAFPDKTFQRWPRQCAIPAGKWPCRRPGALSGSA